MFGKHLRCDFFIIVKEIIEDNSDFLLGGVSVVIAQGSDVLCVDSCGNLLS